MTSMVENGLVLVVNSMRVKALEECMRREIYEETGLTALKLQLHGFVVFPTTVPWSG